MKKQVKKAGKSSLTKNSVRSITSNTTRKSGKKSASVKGNRLITVLTEPTDKYAGRKQPDNYKDYINKVSSWVYTCGTINATTIAQIPLRLYARVPKNKKLNFPSKSVTETRSLELQALGRQVAGDMEIKEILDHPFLDLMKRVNPFMTGVELLNALDQFLEFTGNSYLYKAYSTLGTLEELWILPSHYVNILPNSSKFIEGYLYMKVYPPALFSIDDIVHFKFYSVQDLYYGMGPLHASIYAADADRDIHLFEDALFRNNARPDFALQTDQNLDESTAERMRHTWEGTYGGVRKGGKVAILEGGLEVKPLSWSPRELAYITGRVITMKEIANAFGVPISMLETENVNRANAEAGEYAHAKRTIKPRCTLIAEKLTEQVLVKDYDSRLFCAFDNPVPEDKEFRLKERKENILMGYSTINQEKKKDREDEVAWGEKPLLPLNIDYIDSPARGQKPTAPGAPDVGYTNPEKEPDAGKEVPEVKKPEVK